MISPGALADRFWDPTGTFPAVWPVQVAYIALHKNVKNFVQCNMVSSSGGALLQSPFAFNAFAIALT
jgi:hypothetical protein